MVKIVAEIGINHNGSVDTAKRLIAVCAAAGCDYVKFQKRTPAICVPPEQRSVQKDTPWGKMSYLEYKERIEFGREQYDVIDEFCRSLGVGWFASVWDTPSVDFMSRYTDVMKIPSALLDDRQLGVYAREKSGSLLVSTGVSTEEEISLMVEEVKPDVLFHTNSTYPAPIDELNLSYMSWLRSRYPNIEIGYSGHEYGLVTTFAAAALGAKWIERHVTLDRNMWGSDQQSSIEPSGIFKLVKGIRDIELSIGGGGPRVVLGGEVSKRKSLRGR